MAPTKMKLRVRWRESGATGEQAAEVEGGGGGGVQGSSSKKPPSPAPPVMSGEEEASPDSKCPICLDRFSNVAFLDRCLHRFCFPCIQQWSRNKAECPLCKQAFTSILHSLRSHRHFQEYTLRPPSTTTVEEPPRRRRRRRRGELESGEGVARRRERGGGGGGGRGGSRARERQREEESGLLPLAPPLPSLAPRPSDSPGGEEGGDRGVLFDGLAGLGGAVGPVAPGDRSARRLMSRLAARRRVQQGGGAPRRLREREMLAFRRALYRSGVRALLGHQGQPQRDVSAEGLVRSPGQLGRLRPWLRRELTVLYGTHGSLVDVVQRIIASRITRRGLEHTPGLEDELRPFLLARTQHFLHELAGFARSALSMERYDAQAVYEPLAPPLAPPPSSPADALSGSARSSVIAISEGEEPADRTGNLLSLSTWDEDTPGPSYSTAEPAPSSAPPSPGPEAQEMANGVVAGGEEECLIVGYVKPMAERTPELVQLSSDTEEDQQEVLPPLPSLLPSLTEVATPPSSSSTERHTHLAAASPSRSLPHASPSGSLPQAWSCSSNSPCEQERASREGGRRSGEREEGSSGGLEKERCPLYPSIYCGLDFPRSRSSSSSLPRSPSSPEASPWEYPPSHRPTPPSSSSPGPPERHGDKPGGKRKYKSRHLDEDQDPSWRPGSGRRRDAHKERGGGEGGGEKRAEKRGRERGRRRERERRRDAHKHNSVCEDQSSSSSSRGGGGHRSPSVEIIYEGKVGSSAPSRSKRVKKRHRHRKHQHNSSPMVIIIDSNSSPDDGSHGDRLPMFSDLGDRQPIDFSVSNLPSLPLVEPGGGGDGLGAHIGELPVHILARGSDWSDTEPCNQSKTSDVLAVDISDDDDDDDDDDDEQERARLGEKRKLEEERGASDGEGDENRFLATIMDEIAQLKPGGRGPNSALLLRPGTKRRRRGRSPEEVEESSDLTALPPCDETRPLECTRPLHDPGPFPETRPLDGTRPLKWNHPLWEPRPPNETCPMEWSSPVSETRPLYTPRPLSDPHRLEWTHPPIVPCPLGKPRPLEWTLPLNETALKQEMAADQTMSLPVCSSNTAALSSSAEALPPGMTSLAVNCDTSTAKPCPDLESSTSTLFSPAPSQSVTSDPGQGRLKPQLPVGPVCVSGTAVLTQTTED
ncbi:E3 ubiquitin-protein ligase Topors [Merluccius polli]|uniref:E3 ubiquitin-protein ligase Topors n=1 Tax=Merluccius polli TaxID=89951 RepID=A0AA47N500_MERPO|nr:E3 ubiquitin-protein ligase Topors [Merluccius polli]